MDIKQLQKYQTALEKRLDELTETSRLSKESRDAVELDQTRQGRLSRQDALMQQEMANAAERNRQNEIQKVHQALKRIDNGEFGYCVMCDEDIAEKRLNLDPAVSLCIDCASNR